MTYNEIERRMRQRGDTGKNMDRYLVSFRCYYPESIVYSHHIQELAPEEIEKWMEAYHFIHPNVAAITVRVLFTWKEEQK